MTKEELFALMEQIAEEREAARPVVEKLASGEEPIEDIEIAEGWRTRGFVHELSLAAARISEAQPTRSRLLQQIALSAVFQTAGEETDVVAQYLRGVAWRELGFVHYFQGGYEAASRAYASAHEIFVRTAVLSHEEARTSLSEAGCLLWSRQFEKAAKATENAAVVFAAFGDKRRVAMSEVERAVLDQVRGNLEAARQRYERILPDIDDCDTLARVHNNLGAACADLGDSAMAALHYQKSRALHEELGNTLLVNKVDWGLGRVLVTLRKFEQAERIFTRLREVFLVQELPEDAGEVALDLVEILVATNRLDDARVLTESVIDEYRRANLVQPAIIALGYLRDLLGATQHAQQAVKHVRSFVAQLRTDPHLLFLPLEN